MPAADVDDTTMSISATVSGDASVSSGGGDHFDAAARPPPPKKKRNQPGMPDPDAEVIALSPKTLMATNRFVCEICNKGFQRDQNLQLHRRGHNLPWKLRQRSNKELRKRVYVCPEPTCVHNDPFRALGDLTGIKKHFCRKHGEKKWKCEKCSKKYAVQSDWKAHSKICGTREYKCDCGTLFSRRDSFISHRAFCDALAEESARKHPASGNNKIDGNTKPSNSLPPPPVPLPLAPPSPVLSLPPQPVSMPAPAMAQSAAVGVSSVLPVQNSELIEEPSPVLEEALPSPPVAIVSTGINGSYSSSSSCNSVSCGNTSSSVFASLFASSTTPSTSTLPSNPNPGYSDFIQTMSPPECPARELPPPSSSEMISLCLATSHGSSIFAPAGQECRQYAPAPQPAMSATALLQKAAQIGAAGGGSLLRGLGLMSSGQSSGPSENLQWAARQVKPENSPVTSGIGIGLGLHCGEGSGLKELMIGSSSMSNQPTLDFLGLMTSIGGGLDMSAASSYQGGEFSGNNLEGNS
ncbi:zinc finger protein GAI-ASSOCIATED FACTOR 1-like [Silene latifolia]|uniref:zinc finger protein GAI-ASSOCIATED FACTOR 1-like n=1 Tax=Silene latifolia TaxID=37657 RepID=UPI003D777727